MEETMALMDLLADGDRVELKILNRHRDELYWSDVIRTIGLVIQRLRLEKGWSIDELATQANVDAQILTRIELVGWTNAYLLESDITLAIGVLGGTLSEVLAMCNADLGGLRRFLYQRGQKARSVGAVI